VAERGGTLLARKLRDWQEKYNPVRESTSWVELDERHFSNTRPHDAVLESMGTSCFLFRDASCCQPEDRNKPIQDKTLRILWYWLLNDLERRCESLGETLDDGSRLQFVVEDRTKSPYVSHFSLHSLRVALITAFALEGGVPFPILSKLIAGHSRLVMTLHYTKAGKAYVTEVMRGAEKKLLEGENQGYRRFLQEATYEQIEESFAYNDPSAIVASNRQKTAAGFVVEDKGICPVGCGSCHIGGENLRKSTDPRFSVHAPVPGYPNEKNCVRCRFFITGPAFLPGLIAHFNFLSFQLTECSKRYVPLERSISELEDSRLQCEAEGNPFLRTDVLDRTNRVYEQEAVKADKICHDLHAALQLIDRCQELLGKQNEDGVKLVPVGKVTDLQYALEETESELYQLQVICENAIIYPEIDAGKAHLRRSQILDVMLTINGLSPVFFKLSEDEQLKVGNEMMRLVCARTGSLTNAVLVGEGRVLLEQIGLLGEASHLIENRKTPQITPAEMESVAAKCPQLALISHKG